MNQIATPVIHPIAIGVPVKALRPSCACKGAKMQHVNGKVMKVIHNNSGYWYYLTSGVTVRGDWIQSVGD